MSEISEHIDQNETLIEIKNLQKAFNGNQVLKDINLTIKRSENIVVLGKSGIGKSVLIKCIVGLIQPDSGVLKVFGREVTEMNQKELNDLRTRVGFIFQGNALYDSMTVRENLEFPLRRNKIMKDTKLINELILDVLDSVGLLEAIDKMPSELSGGMKKELD